MIETYFMITAESDLCKIGDSHLCKALKLNKDKLREYYWYGYDGNIRISEDRYEDKAELATIEDCITALKKDIKETNDISENYPEMVREMHKLFKKYIIDGRSN